jgi:hypothetical protein
MLKEGKLTEAGKLQNPVKAKWFFYLSPPKREKPAQGW